MNKAEQALATLREYLERSTGPAIGVTRGDALRALQVLEDERCLICRQLAEVCGAAHGGDELGCPTCSDDGGTSCGMPNCGLLQG